MLETVILKHTYEYKHTFNQKCIVLFSPARWLNPSVLADQCAHQRRENSAGVAGVVNPLPRLTLCLNTGGASVCVCFVFLRMRSFWCTHTLCRICKEQSRRSRPLRQLCFAGRSHLPSTFIEIHLRRQDPTSHNCIVLVPPHPLKEPNANPINTNYKQHPALTHKLWFSLRGWRDLQRRRYANLTAWVSATQCDFSLSLVEVDGDHGDGGVGALRRLTGFNKKGFLKRCKSLSRERDTEQNIRMRTFFSLCVTLETWRKPC